MMSLKSTFTAPSAANPGMGGLTSIQFKDMENIGT
jgi:hypothetical protein